MTYEQNYLAHFGIKGQKWGLRRYQNEDGSLTQEGRDHYGVGEEREFDSGWHQPERYYEQRPRFQNYAARVNQNNTNSVSNRNSGTIKDPAKQRERIKKIAIAVGAISLAAVLAYAQHKHHKTTVNLMEMAKNKIDADSNMIARNLSGEALAKNRYWRMARMNSIVTRKDALKTLGLRRRSQARAFIRDNKVAKMSTIDIVERRMGPLAKGHYRTIFGKMKPITGRRLTRMKKQALRNLGIG